MKKKMVKKFIYKGFGFPIKLVNVPMVKVFGKWAMDINFNKLRLTVLHHLLLKAEILSGAELKFIRQFLNMTTTEFGNIFEVSHVSVLNWEKGVNQIASTTDIYLRLYVLDQLRVKDKEFRTFYSNITHTKLAKPKAEKPSPLLIDIHEELKTA